ncbi:class I SAM-dependent methyltransferase [Sneathiella sp.]|uniref:class I SAM-dependent methyltransferase n=1 Tax=Sneathiella sp. TaxID=1964365 RepID=UPI002FDF1120
MMADKLDRETFLAAIDFSRLGEEAKVQPLGAWQNYLDLRPKGKGGADNDFNKQIYDTDIAISIEVYGNFLKWLFATFNTTEEAFRRDVIGSLNLKPGDKVLVTSMGLGEEVEVCADYVGPTGAVHGQDLNRRFVRHASEHTQHEQVFFTVSDALDLPYRDNYFDAVYHFGGINLFGDIHTALLEMTRVCKPGGKILFGDESLAMHLRDTEYGRMVLKNNPIWGAPLPLEELPVNARNISIRYVLGNCFYLIGFEKGEGFPEINIDVPHIGYRGGTIRTRYFGEIEGVDIAAREKVYAYAKEHNISVHELLSKLIHDNFD